NYGWPEVEGYSTDSRFKSPLHAYPHAIGRCVVSGAFCPNNTSAVGGAGLFPEKWRGKFFFADWSDNWMKALDPSSPANATTFAKGFNAPVAMQFASDSSLLVLNRGTIWRDGKKWQPNTGSLVRIRHGASPSATARGNVLHPALPRTITATDILKTLRPFPP